ncbi:MAG: hypothetical protein HKN74_11935 [Acidimicrobiia bacterium]|nr:hypothetical protein [Acidimicrobiia bacterium]NNF10988.1 hypothetical protein [Acidimicrobiia bacterium]NNL70765.1 hypothetical protein [Acidimicrobiia bacterium]
MNTPFDLVDDLPPEVVDDLPPSVIDQIRNEGLEKLPETVVDRLPDTVVDRIPSEFIEGASANPALVAILVVVGLIAVAGFVYGIAKSAFKAAFFFGVVAAGAWYWYFNA